MRINLLLAALALNACATGGAASPSESEPARLSRELAEARQQVRASQERYDQAYGLLVRRNAGNDVSAEAAQLPPPAAPRVVPPVERPVARPAAPPQAAPAPPPPPAPVPDMSGFGGLPLGSAPTQMPDIMSAPEIGALGNMAWMGPLPDELRGETNSRVAIVLHGVSYDVQILIDGRTVCPTMDGRTTTRILTRNRRVTCIVPARPGQTQELTVFIPEITQAHTIELIAYYSSRLRPVGTRVGTLRQQIVPLRNGLIQAMDGWFR